MNGNRMTPNAKYVLLADTEYKKKWKMVMMVMDNKYAYYGSYTIYLAATG